MSQQYLLSFILYGVLFSSVPFLAESTNCPEVKISPLSPAIIIGKWYVQATNCPPFQPKGITCLRWDSGGASAYVKFLTKVGDEWERTKQLNFNVGIYDNDDASRLVIYGCDKGDPFSSGGLSELVGRLRGREIAQCAWILTRKNLGVDKLYVNKVLPSLPEGVKLTIINQGGCEPAEGHIVSGLGDD